MADPTGVFVLASVVSAATVSTATNAVAANKNRAGGYMQNQGTNALFVLYGNGASSSNYHVILKGGTAVSDGNGGILDFTLGGPLYTGQITVAGTVPTYTLCEFS